MAKSWRFKNEITEILSARWDRSEKPESESLLQRESVPALPFSKKSLTMRAKSCSLSWLNPPPMPLAHKSPAAVAVVVVHNNSIANPPLSFRPRQFPSFHFLSPTPWFHDSIISCDSPPIKKGWWVCQLKTTERNLNWCFWIFFFIIVFC